jgi:TonB family protein
MISKRLVAAVAVAAVAACQLPASAQYANEYSPAKLVHRGTTTVPISGSGTVVVQVQVNADGTHKVIKVIRSTNSKNNAAAMQIAQSSTYRPARKGTTPITAFYDFTLKFNGNSVETGGEEVVSGSPAARIDALIRAGKYSEAKAAAQAALANSPDNATLNEELGTANYFLTDYAGAAQAFEKVQNVTKTFAQVAAQSYAMAAVKGQVSTDEALEYAKRAVALAPGGSTYYALGVAELNAGQATAAIGDLKKGVDAVTADPKADTQTKVAFASELYQAYLKAGDNADAEATLQKIKQMDPNNASVTTLEGNRYLQQGNDAANAGNHDEALKDFLQAASVGSTAVQVTAYSAAAFQQAAILAAAKTPATKDDYAKVAAYAQKALAINPNDAQANYAYGVGLAGEYIVGGKQDASLKSQAVAALNKAKDAAQASGNMALSLQISNFIKQQNLQ